MKFKIKAILILTLVSVMLTGQVASAATYVGMDEEGFEKFTKGIITEDTYYVSSKEEEIIEFNRGMATNKPFTLDFASEYMDGIDWYNPVEGIQDYANSHYAYYNFRYGAYDFYEKTEDGKDILRVRFDWYGKETVEETKYVYNFIREMIRNNPSIIKASDYDKTKWAYDWIVSNVKYDYTYKNSSAYQGLTESTVCEGYAKIFYVFATELGLDCFIVDGMANGTGVWEGHAWNVVQMEDGKWYCVDTTFASTSGKDYFLKGEISFNVTHTLNECFEGLLDISQYDYVNTGNSRRGGVLASVYDVKMDVFKKNILGIGDEYQWLLDNPNNIDLTFTSDNEDVAKVDKNGKIIAVSEGTATIKAINEELGIEQSCIIVVDNYYTKIVEVEDVVVKYGKKKKLKINVKPYGKQLENVKYESLDKSIATVNDSGTVKGVRIGTTHIRITYDDGKELMAKVTVKPYVEKTELNIDVGDYVEIGDIVQISKKGIKDLKVKVSNTKVATVNSSGWIRGLKEGTCKIYVYDKVTGKKVTTLNVKVTK